MRKESYEMKKENDIIRMRIINDLMQIIEPEQLKNIKALTEVIQAKNEKERPMDIIDIAALLAPKDVKRLLMAIEKIVPANIAMQQMKEAFTNVLKRGETA